MATFTTITRKDAPARRPQASRAAALMREYEDYLKALKATEVGRLIPDDGESTRSLVLRVCRAARRLDRKATTWIVDGAVYFQSQ
jgi:acyl-CoA reductase-like NAD-dependent aldehyde dehydrogenase